MGYSQVGKALDSDSSIPQVRVLLPQKLDPLAQSVEHLTFNQGVRGSNPRWVKLESYRSGHNGAVLKTVRVQAHGGSNPSLSVNGEVLKWLKRLPC